MSDIVEQLRSESSTQLAFGQDLSVLLDAALEIERLRDKCDKQAMILRRLNPENFPGTYFICGELGEKDKNGMPEKIHVVPSYGVDFSYEYVYNGKVTGPEW